MSKKRKDGRLATSFTWNGKRYYVYGRTRQELFEKEAARRRALEEKQARRTDPTVQQFFDGWIEGKRGTIKESSIRLYKIIFQRVEDVPLGTGLSFKDMKIAEITPADVRQVRSALVSSGLKTSTVNSSIRTLKTMFDAAYREQVITFNPFVTLPRLKRAEIPARDSYHRDLTDAELKLFFDAVKDSYYLNLYRLALYTGMRFGELTALSYEDVKADAIIVEKSLTRSESGKAIIGDGAKTPSGIRSIPLTPLLREIIDAQKEQNAALFGGKVPHGLLFPSFNGCLLEQPGPNAEIRRVCDKLGIEHFTFHAFRDTFATMAANRWGFEPLVLKEILGHKDISITMNLYARSTNDRRLDAMQRVSSPF